MVAANHPHFKNFQEFFGEIYPNRSELENTIEKPSTRLLPSPSIISSQPTKGIARRVPGHEILPLSSQYPESNDYIFSIFLGAKKLHAKEPISTTIPRQ